MGQVLCVDVLDDLYALATRRVQTIHQVLYFTGQILCWNMVRWMMTVLHVQFVESLPPPQSFGNGPSYV